MYRSPFPVLRVSRPIPRARPSFHSLEFRHTLRFLARSYLTLRRWMTRTFRRSETGQTTDCCWDRL